jgi:hypothetical protein
MIKEEGVAHMHEQVIGVGKGNTLLRTELWVAATALTEEKDTIKTLEISQTGRRRHDWRGRGVTATPTTGESVAYLRNHVVSFSVFRSPHFGVFHNNTNHFHCNLLDPARTTCWILRGTTRKYG